MRILITATICAVIGATLAVVADQNPRDRPAVVERFLSTTDQSLVSFRGVRRLSASARGGRMTATLTARTSLDPERGFSYQVLDESGSGLIRSRVLRAALEGERQARLRGDIARSELTDQNYEFTRGETLPEGLVRVMIHPRRKEAMLVDGSVLLTEADADLVRIEGSLVKRPSFWTRRVEIVRHYARIDGVRVPVAMTSIADVLIAGQSTFSMQYEYETINGLPVQGSAFKVQGSLNPVNLEP